jgi:hypothetical protein
VFTSCRSMLGLCQAPLTPHTHHCLAEWLVHAWQIPTRTQFRHPNPAPLPVHQAITHTLHTSALARQRWPWRALRAGCGRCRHKWRSPARAARGPSTPVRQAPEERLCASGVSEPCTTPSSTNEIKSASNGAQGRGEGTRREGACAEQWQLKSRTCRSLEGVGCLTRS